jgi:hypothetical protein
MQTISNTSPKKGFSFGLQPALAWTAILGFVLFTALGIIAGAGSIIRLVYPVGAFAVGVLLYLRYPVLYIGFTWWLWFVTAFVRRLIDYRSGWDPQGLILIAPYLVTFISLYTFVRYFPKTSRQGTLPFVLAALAVFYGFLLGLIQFPPFSVVRALLDWLGPIIFGFHLFVNWREYPSYRQNIQRTFLWGVLVTGAYGVVQYLVAPEWDRYWLINSKLVSMGNPVPLGMRVWSTLNSVAPFASVMMAGLLLLFTAKGPWRFPAAAVGFLSFFLSQSRSGWLGWLLGLIFVISAVKPRLQMRLITTVLIVAVCVVPLSTMEPFSDIIGTRMQTFTNLEKDNSANVRQEIYKENLGRALASGLGSGLGNVWVVKDNGQVEVLVIDSGVIEILMTLGWFGAIPYLSGIFLILFRLFKSSESRFDIFASTCRAIGISCFLQLIGGSAQLGLSGLLMWGFLGMGMAANKYYQHQHLLEHYQHQHLLEPKERSVT